MSLPPPFDEDARLAALRGYDILDTPPEAAYDRLCRLAAALFDAPMALLAFVDADRVWYKARLGIDRDEVPRAGALCDATLGSEGVTLVEDAAATPCHADALLVAGVPHARFFAGAPVRTPDGIPLGALCVLDAHPRTCTEAQTHHLAALADTAAALLEARRSARARCHAEQALQESERRYRLLFDHAPDPIVLHLEGKIVEANEAAVRATRAEAHEDLLGQPVLRFVHPEYQQAVAARIRECLDSGQPLPMLEERLLRLDGTPFDAEVQAVPVPYHGHQALQVTMRDVTRRKQAWQRLHRRLSLEKTVARIARALLATEVDLDHILALLGRVVRVHRTYLFTYRDGGATMDNTHEWCAPGIEPQREHLQGLPADVFPWWMARLQQGAPLRIPDVAALPPEAATEREVLAEQGIRSLLSVPVILKGGRHYGFLGFDDVERPRTWRDEDVRVLRLASDLLAAYFTEQQAQEALRESEVSYRGLFNGVTEAIFVQDRDGLLLDVNQGALDMYGYSRDALLGHPMSTLADPQHYDAGRLAGYLAEAFTGTPQRFLFWGLQQDGTAFPQEVVFNRGRYLGQDVVITTARDVTERVRHEAALVAAKEAAEEMNQLKNALLANMSHEIRTPLTSIIGFAEVLGDQATGPYQQLAHLIGRGGLRLMQTLNSVLDLAQIEGGALKLVPELLDVVHQLREMVEFFRPQAAERGLHLTLDAPTDAALYVHQDRTALDRVCTNLIANAIKFTRQGGVTVRVAARASQVEIAVCDTGVGIAEPFMPYLFEAFKQESEGIGRGFEGSGLGLTITKHLLDLMGGSIEVHSRKGEGTTFTVRLPLDEG